LTRGDTLRFQFGARLLQLERSLLYDLSQMTIFACVVK
jgi:hypothetical protein